MITLKVDSMKAQMAKRGFSALGLSRAAGVSQSYFCQILNRKRMVAAPTAKKICDALDCSFDDVFTFQAEDRPAQQIERRGVIV